MKYVYVPVLAKVVRLMWHGTSSVNLRSILKQGLIPNSKQNKKNYDESDTLSALHDGTYLTSSMKIAYLNYAIQHAETYNANPVLVLCSISADQQHVKLDEDYFSGFMPQLCLTLTEMSEKSKQRRLAFAYDQFRDLLYNSFPTIPKSKFERLLNSPSLRNHLEQIVETSLDEFSMYDLLEDENYYNQRFSDELGKLSQFIRMVNSPVSFIKSALNLAITTPIKYRGSKRIVAIFEQTNGVVASKYDVCIFKQVYGDRKYKKIFIQDWVKLIKRPIEFVS